MLPKRLIPTASLRPFAAALLFVLQNQAGPFSFHPRSSSQSLFHIPLRCWDAQTHFQPALCLKPSSCFFSPWILGVESAIWPAFQDDDRIFITFVPGAPLPHLFAPVLSAVVELPPARGERPPCLLLPDVPQLQQIQPGPARDRCPPTPCVQGCHLGPK